MKAVWHGRNPYYPDQGAGLLAPTLPVSATPVQHIVAQIPDKTTEPMVEGKTLRDWTHNGDVVERQAAVLALDRSGRRSSAGAGPKR